MLLASCGFRHHDGMNMSFSVLTDDERQARSTKMRSSFSYISVLEVLWTKALFLWTASVVCWTECTVPEYIKSQVLVCVLFQMDLLISSNRSLLHPCPWENTNHNFPLFRFTLELAVWPLLGYPAIQLDLEKLDLPLPPCQSLQQDKAKAT